MAKTIEALLRLKAENQTLRAFNQVSASLDKIDKKTRQVNRSQQAAARVNRFESLERQAVNTSMVIGRAFAPAAIGYGLGASIKDFAAFERQMNRIGITAGATVEQTTAVSGSVQDLASKMAMPLDAAITGLDTLVSSGMSLEQAMAFLPSVLTTAQATGAATDDIANTALKSASALQLQAGEMQDAFDIMVAGGKAGQFELKDMAAYIPGLANSFSSLGYTGQEGLKALIATLQTIREDTGTAEAAATQAQNIFGKMYSSDTAKKFKNFGIDLRKEMEAGKAAGEGALDAFVRLSKEAIDGDLSKLPLLFTDQEFRLGMQSLMTSADSYQRFIDVVNGSEVKGTSLKDAQRIMNDTDASIQRMANSWDKFVKSVGGATAPTAVALLDNLSSGIDNAPKADEIRKARGDSILKRTLNYASGPEDAKLVAEYDAYEHMTDPGTAERVGMEARRRYANRGKLDGDTVQRTAVPLPHFRDAPIPAEKVAAVAASTARTAPIISARQAETQSMLSLRGQFGAVLAAGGTSFQPGISGQDLTDEAALPNPMPVVVSNIAELAPEPRDTGGMTAPTIGSREAEAASMAALRSQYGGMLNPDGQSFRRGTSGQDVIDEVDPDALRQAMEAGAQSVAQGGRDAQAAIDQGGAKLPAQGQQAGEALAAAAGAGLVGQAQAAGAAMAQSFNANVRVPAARPAQGVSPGGRDLGTSMPDAGN